MLLLRLRKPLLLKQKIRASKLPLIDCFPLFRQGRLDFLDGPAVVFVIDAEA